MYPLHRAYVRFYPTLLVALTIAQRALAFDGGSAEGDPAATEEAPKLDVIADEFAIPGEPFRFEVEAREPLREIYAHFVGLRGKAGRHFPLKLDDSTGLFRADLPIPTDLDADRLVVRVVARDRAGNRIEYQVTVPVLSGFDCCEDDQETCGLQLTEPVAVAEEVAPAPAKPQAAARQAQDRLAPAQQPAAAPRRAPSRSAQSSG